MAWTGRATYTDSDSIAEDVSSLITLTSHLDTPFLDFIGNPSTPANNIKYEWLTEASNAKSDPLATTVNDSLTTIVATDGTKFKAGMIIRIGDELMLVDSIATHTLTVNARGYGDSTAAAHTAADTIHIVAWPALEGEDAPASRETSRTRVYNYTQIFDATVSISESEKNVNQIGIANEYEHQKALRLRELNQDLETAVFTSSWHSTTPQGSTTVRRTMQGMMYYFSTNATNASAATLGKDNFTGWARTAWSNGARNMNLITCNAFQKSKFDDFITSARRYGPSDELMKLKLDIVETSFGDFNVMLNHNMPDDEIWLLDTSLIQVKPLKNSSWQHKPLGEVGLSEKGIVWGEYTLEMKNEAGHARIYGLATS